MHVNENRRMRCPVCGTNMEYIETEDILTQTDAENPDYEPPSLYECPMCMFVMDDQEDWGHFSHRIFEPCPKCHNLRMNKPTRTPCIWCNDDEDWAELVRSFFPYHDNQELTLKRQQWIRIRRYFPHLNIEVAWDYKYDYNQPRGHITDIGTIGTLYYMIMRGSGSPCAYIGLPVGHPLYERDYTTLDHITRGSLTFSGVMEDVNMPTQLCKNYVFDIPWWLGWDYNNNNYYCQYDPDPTGLLKGSPRGKELYLLMKTMQEQQAHLPRVLIRQLYADIAEWYHIMFEHDHGELCEVCWGIKQVENHEYVCHHNHDFYCPRCLREGGIYSRKYRKGC